MPVAQQQQGGGARAAAGTPAPAAAPAEAPANNKGVAYTASYALTYIIVNVLAFLATFALRDAINATLDLLPARQELLGQWLYGLLIMIMAVAISMFVLRWLNDGERL